jgi:predicted 3-demethylubiquinone-9 3-methyltransferase (glyoxalase superfamily)
VPQIRQKITPCLWFDTQAEEAANFYTSVFKNSRIKQVSRFGKAGREVHGKEAGSVMIVEFEIEGQTFTALNGGPLFKFNEAVSFQVSCDTQAEIDHFWNSLSRGGQESSCGWLKDKFGVSWQVIPKQMDEYLKSPDREASRRAFEAMLKMSKLDVEQLREAYEGVPA